MPERNGGRTNSSVLTMVFAAIAIFLTLAQGFWSLANPRDDIKGLKDDFIKFRDEVRWVYATKELVTSVKDENVTYRRGMEMIINRIDVKANALDNDIHSVGFKDAITAVQNRIVELERALRDATTTKQPAVSITPAVPVRP